MPEVLLARHLCVIAEMLIEKLIVFILRHRYCGIYCLLLLVLYKGQFRTVQIKNKKGYRIHQRKSHGRQAEVTSFVKSVHRVAGF